ncbi:MAG: hypothetical protein ACLP5H_04880 [Desulfomonilaceae bacterium]
MNITIVLEVMVSSLIMAAFLTPLLEAPAMALGPSGKCYVDCTGGGIPSNPREHNACLSACIFGEGVQRLDHDFLPPPPQLSDRPRGQQTGQK